MDLIIDFETRSAADLRACGAAAYAQHPSTEVICLAVLDRGKPAADIWFSPKFRSPDTGVLGPIPDERLRELIEGADTIEAHNAQFEYFIWKYVMGRYGFAPLPKDKMRCSAAKAALYGLPRDLAGACSAAGVDQQKDMAGHRLMLKLCKPRRPRKAELLLDPRGLKTYWHEDTGDIVRLGRYCLQDVLAERALSSALPKDLPEVEQRLWRLDLEINDRGFRIDVPAVRSILDVVTRHTESLTDEFRRMTGLASPRQRDATLQHLRALGVDIEGLTASDVAAALEGDNCPTARRILEIRQSLSKASTAKYTAMLGAVGEGDRIRGCFMYHGAGTGRWSGRIVQPQNFPRGAFPDVDACISLFQKGDVDSIELLYGDPMAAASTCIRGVLVPAPGRDFVCADFSSIEGRVLAWLAGEQAALDVYRSGRDPYKVAASAIYHVPYEAVTKPQRQIGKVAELALGYQGSVGAFNAMAAGYGVTLDENEVKTIVEKWRGSRPRTVNHWKEIERACFEAVRNPGTIYSCGKVKFVVRGMFLCLRLPSWRCLYYANPRMEPKEMPWGGMKDVVAVDGTNSVTRKWTTQYLYGGLLTENATQAVARDLLANGMFNVEKAGYPVVLHVHDEVVSEVPEGFGSVEEYEKLLCTLPDWADGLPVGAEGWRGKRYRK